MFNFFKKKKTKIENDNEKDEVVFFTAEQAREFTESDEAKRIVDENRIKTENEEKQRFKEIMRYIKLMSLCGKYRYYQLLTEKEIKKLTDLGYSVKKHKVTDYYSISWAIQDTENPTPEISVAEEENNEPDLCLFCNGTGEGMTPDTTCQTCKGSGVKPQPKHNPYE